MAYGLDGRYDAIQHADGTWTVRDLPIVHEGTIPRFNRVGEKVDDFAVTPEWMAHVILVNGEREREGFMARAFVDHHETGSSQPDAGFVRPTRVGSVTIDGVSMAALMADLIQIPDSVYREWVQTGRLPYRSIESLHAESGFIDGLALMPTTPPHFKLPMLTIRSEAPRDVASATAAQEESTGLLVACGSAKQAQAAIRRHEMSDAQLTLKAEDKKEDPEMKAPHEGGGEMDVASLCEMLKSGAIPLSDFAAVREAMSEAESMANGDGDMKEEIMEDELQVVDQPEPAMSGAKYDAKLEARLAVAEGKITARETADAAEASIKAAVADVAEYNLGDDNEVVLRAQFGKGGAAGLSGFVAAILASAPKSRLGDPDSIPGGLTSDPLGEEVEQFTDPTDRAEAIKAHKSWDAQVHAGFDMGTRSKNATITRAVTRARAVRS